MKCILTIILFFLFILPVWAGGPGPEISDNITKPLLEERQGETLNEVPTSEQVKDCEWVRFMLKDDNRAIVIGPETRRCIEILMRAKRQAAIERAREEAKAESLASATSDSNNTAVNTTIIDDNETIAVAANETQTNVIQTDDNVTLPISYVADMQPGYLSTNIFRILNQYGWSCPPGWWNASEDFYVVNPYVIKADTIFELMNKVLAGYKLKIYFYAWDHTVRVTKLEER